MIIVPGPRTKAFDVRNLVLPYMKLQSFVELFSCPTIYKIPETCPRTAAARCRGAIQPGIFTAQTCCISRSQCQGLAAPVLCHRHHLPAGGPYMIRMKTSQKQARKTCKGEHTIYTMHTQGVTLEFPATNSMYPTFRGLFSVRDPRFVHLSMS